MKLFDLIEDWFGQILSKNLKNKAAGKITSVAKEIEQIDEVMDNLNDALIETKEELKQLIKNQGAYSKQALQTRDNIKQLEKELKEENAKKSRLLKDLAKQTNLTSNEIEDYIEQIKLHGEEAVKSGTSTAAFRNIMSKATAALGFDLKALAGEFLTLSAIVAGATEQLVRSNNYLVELSRKTGGAISYRNLGFDAYGNNLTNTGSLSALTNINNISEEQFFEAMQGFNKGNIIGQDYSKAAADLQRFGVHQARLIKLYGASASDVQKITEVTTQLYGVSIKNLNKEFESGAKTAKMAGLNVQEYFKNLARISELTGEVYIKNGLKGMQDLALFATKFNTSVDGLLKFGQSFENISDIYDKQAKASNLGLRNFANQSALMFSQYQLGNLRGLSQTAITSLARDLQKYTDREGSIDLRGIRAMKELGFGPEQVQLVQRTIQAQKKLNVSFSELADTSKLSSKKQFEYYMEMNRSATIQEKLNKLWGQFKSVILDPIASILGPALDVVINLLIATFQTLYVVLKPIIYGFQILGAGLTKVSNIIAGATGWLEEKLKGLGISSNKFGSILEKLSNIAGTVIAALIALRAAAWATAFAQQTSSKLSGALGTLTDFMPGRLKGLGRLTRMKGLANIAGGTALNAAKGIPKLLKGGLGLAAVGGLAGDAISSLGEEGSTVNRSGTALSGAAYGATIGSIIPGVGTAIGAALGGLVGSFWPEIKSGVLSLVDWAGKTFDLWDDYTSKDEDAKKIIMSAQTDPFDFLNKANNILSQRIVEPFKAERAQEKAIQNLTKPVIYVEQNRLFQDAKVKLSGL